MATDTLYKMIIVWISYPPAIMMVIVALLATVNVILSRKKMTVLEDF